MIIYLIQNRVNEKVYVGQTISTLKKHWQVYRSPSASRIGHVPPILKRAMAKHGVENFFITAVAEAKSKEQLNQLEKLWIWALRATDRNFGYNLTVGGTGGNMVGEAVEHHKKRIKEGRLMARLVREGSFEFLKKPEKAKGQSRNVVGEKNPMYGRPGTRGNFGTVLNAEQKKRILKASLAGKEKSIIEKYQGDFNRYKADHPKTKYNRSNFPGISNNSGVGGARA